jgi:hypothetical protein
LNKVNSRRLQDLNKFELSDDPLERVDNSIYDFLNRESKKSVVNPKSFEARETNGSDELFVSSDLLGRY